MNYLPYFGVIPAVLMTVQAVTETKPTSGDQLKDLVVALLSLAGTILLPYVIQRVRKLTAQVKKNASNIANGDDVMALIAEVKQLRESVGVLQSTVDITTEERDRLIKEVHEQDIEFQKTLLTQRNEFFAREQTLTNELREERATNASLAGQFEALYQELAELKQQISVMAGANELAERLMREFRSLNKQGAI